MRKVFGKWKVAFHHRPESEKSFPTLFTIDRKVFGKQKMSIDIIILNLNHDKKNCHATIFDSTAISEQEASISRRVGTFHPFPVRSCWFLRREVNSSRKHPGAMNRYVGSER